ncbi:hypothetical protein HPB49_006211 [Dermacentor silvarum]|uniref:Uncharacterized protein n=1 Tax=Dermacentor silvarum TaxID=543639 RepID=A0ACB8C2E2_DERSI|nr:hypothetical protein HPB49_006211 [Dermacentor silvarum]
MSCIELAPPPPFLPVPGRPPVPCPQWHRMFENFLLASGASDFKPERRKTLLIHSLGVEGQRIFSSVLLTSNAAQSGESTASGKRSEDIGDVAQPSVYDETIETFKQHFTSTSNVVAERHKGIGFAVVFSNRGNSLRDQFMEGIASQHLRERLFREGSTHSFCRAVALASQVEQANKDIREFASGNVQRISGHSRLALNDHRRTGTRHPSSRDDAPLRAPRSEASLLHDSRQPASYLRPYNSSSHCYLRLLQDWLRVVRHHDNPDWLASRKLREFRLLAAQLTETRWRTMLNFILRSSNTNRPAQGKPVVVLDEVSLPEGISSLLEKGPKYAVPPPVRPHDL